MANHSSYSNYSVSRRGTSPLKIFGVSLVALLVVGGGVVGALHAAGVIDLPFLRGEPSHIGQVLVPMSGQPIAAFTKVTRDHLTDPHTRIYSVQWMDKELVEMHKIIVDPRQIAGRVLDHDKSPGYAFTEEDFLPKGTRPGVVAGIPPGKRSMTLEAGKIQGVHALKAGDRFDLLATSQIEPAKNGGLPANAMHIGPAPLPGQKQAKVQVLVINGMIVTPASLRAEPTTTSSLMGGTRTSTKPVQEIVIAVDPQELSPLSEALVLDAHITCVARSGHPDDSGTSNVPPSIRLDDKPHVIETISGKKRNTLIVPAAVAPPRSSPVVPVSGTGHHDHGTNG